MADPLFLEHTLPSPLSIRASFFNFVLPPLEIIESDARHVFEDVVDEFIAIDRILKRFADWRKTDKTAYVEAYANMCLPKILGPIIRMNMLMWNPLLKVVLTKFCLGRLTLYKPILSIDANEATKSMLGISEFEFL